MGKRIVLFLMCLLVVIGHLSAQVTKMSGIVLSKDDGLPVVGASVLIQGTTHGTITDVDGKFVLDNIKPTDKKVMVSFIGMKTQVVDVKSFVKVVLVTESEMMEDRKSTRLNSSHVSISYAVFCLKKKKTCNDERISSNNNK